MICKYTFKIDEDVTVQNSVSKEFTLGNNFQFSTKNAYLDSVIRRGIRFFNMMKKEFSSRRMNTPMSPIKMWEFAVLRSKQLFCL